MAKKMTLQEKLAAARAGTPAPSEPAAEATPAAEPAPPAAEPEAPAAPAPAPPPPAAAPTGRPLTLKEKLAAARAGGPPPPPAPAPTPAPPPPAAEAPAAEAPAAAPAPAPAAAPLGRPLTLKEKLAAARGGGGAPAPAAGAPAGAAPAAAKSAPAAKPAADRPLPPLEKSTDPRDLAEHLRREGAQRAKAATADVAAKAATAKSPAKKSAEAKIVPPRPDREAALTEAPSRRGFLAETAVIAWIIAGWGAFVAGLSAFTMVSLRFMFPNVLAEPPSTIKVGLPSNFESGEVNETWKAEWGFWVVRSDAYDGNDVLYALSTICTHLGCPPNWLAAEQKFKCPCHGSGFYVSGVNFEGPAPRPLERYKLSVGDDGQVVVDKSQKFQEELGQWSDPDSYVPMA